MEVGVEVEVDGWGWGVRVEVGLLFRSGGWLEIWEVKLILTQVVVEVEV